MNYFLVTSVKKGGTITYEPMFILVTSTDAVGMSLVIFEIPNLAGVQALEDWRRFVAESPAHAAQTQYHGSQGRQPKRAKNSTKHRTL